MPMPQIRAAVPIFVRRWRYKKRSMPSPSPHDRVTGRRSERLELGNERQALQKMVDTLVDMIAGQQESGCDRGRQRGSPSHAPALSRRSGPGAGCRRQPRYNRGYYEVGDLRWMPGCKDTKSLTQKPARPFLRPLWQTLVNGAITGNLSPQLVSRAHQITLRSGRRCC